MTPHSVDQRFHWEKALVGFVGSICLVAASAGQVTLEKVARVNGPVPGRLAPIVFIGGASEDYRVLSRPSINDAGRVAFRGVSGNQFNFSQDRAVGIYTNTLVPSPTLNVVVDTTSAFDVPGHLGVPFISFTPPILARSVDNFEVVVFRGSFNAGEGLYAVGSSGGPIKRLAESGMAVPDPAGLATSGTFTSSAFGPGGTDAPFWAAASEAGHFVFLANFVEGGNSRVGVFGGTFALGGTVFIRRIADDSATMGLSNELPTVTIRQIDKNFPPAINDSGDVIFGAKVANGVVSAVMTASVLGGSPTTRARENLPSGTPFGNFWSVFNGYDINNAGQYVFHHQFSTGAQALFTDALAGGAYRSVVDTGGTFPVPFRSGAAFTAFSVAAINELGTLGFFARDSDLAGAGVGLYEASLAGCLTPTCVKRIASNSMAPDPHSTPAVFSRFDDLYAAERSAATNDQGNMAFAPIAVLSANDNLFGLYFYSRCDGTVSRILDKTNSAAVLPDGATFGAGADRATRIFQGIEVRSGQYRSINNSNAVAFQAEFVSGDVGIYVARVAVGGQLTINCPSNVTVECPDDTDTLMTGSPTVSGCGTIQVSHSDAETIGTCPKTITRTWTATNGAQSASCVQTILVEDTQDPIFTNPPSNLTVPCNSATNAAELAAWLASVTASDNCGDVQVTNNYQQLVPTCGGAGSTVVTWTATDECQNSVSASATFTIVDNAAPIFVTPPTDRTIECDGNGNQTDLLLWLASPAATDSCSGVTLTNNFSALTQTCDLTGHAAVTWTATDACGNSSSRTATFRIVDTVAPSITCPPDVFVQTRYGQCFVRHVRLGYPCAGDTCSDVTICNDAPSMYDVGETTVTWTATDACGNQSTCAQLVVVEDNTPPRVCASVCNTLLWPPNHELVNVGLDVWIHEACDSGVEPVVTVYANEEDEESTGDGTHSPDAKDIGVDTLRLRAERKGTGSGRVYLIVVEAVDSSGNTATSTATVIVPKNRGRGEMQSALANAIFAQVYYYVFNAPPPGYVTVGDGAIIGPHQ